MLMMRSNCKVIAIGLVALGLWGCSPGVQFVAPEIEPPADLIPGYVPEGFELVSGFELMTEAVRGPLEGSGQDARGIFPAGLVGPLEAARSPSGNSIQGIQYRHGDSLLLITKSAFPGGDLDLWIEALQRAGPHGLANCECATQALPGTIRLPQPVQIVAELDVDGTPVAMVDGLRGRLTVFVRGDDLLTIQAAISQEETLKIVESLLP
jgi:hypothetical protein